MKDEKGNYLIKLEIGEQKKKNVDNLKEITHK